MSAIRDQLDAVRAVGVVDDDAPRLDGRLGKCAVALLSCLLAGRVPPAELCDVVESPGIPLDEGRMRVVTVQSEGDGREGKWFLLGKGLMPKNLGQRPWLLAVKDANTAMQALRSSWGPDPVDIASELMRRGIPFHTLMARDWVERPPTYQRAEVKHHFQQEGYVHSLVDYRAYVCTREAYCLQPHMLRGALRAGGILWRLTVGSLRESSTDWLPSEGAFYEPSLSTEVEGEVFVDDKLSKEEIGLLCGVYYIYKGEWAAHRDEKCR